MRAYLLFAVAVGLVVWGCEQDCVDCTGCWLPVVVQTELPRDSVGIIPPETTRVAGRVTMSGCDYDIQYVPLAFTVSDATLGVVNGMDSVAYDTTDQYGELDFTYITWTPGCNWVKVNRFWHVLESMRLEPVDSVLVCGFEVWP